MDEFRRGDLIFVENPIQDPHGHVVAGNHPAVVIQNQAGNTHSGNLIVAYVTSQLKRLEMPTHVVLQWYPGLKKTSVVQTEQIATIAKDDVMSVIDHLSDADMARVDQAIIVSLGLGGELMPPEVHSILGASAADRWMHCPPSARLTADMEDEGSVFAAEGTAAHELCEWKVRKALKMRAGTRPASEYWTDEMEECSDDYRDYILDLVGEAKKTCKDPITLVEQHLDFSCYVPDGFGTGDFLLVADKTLNVVDFKYGRGVAVYADHNPQMMLYSLGALNLFDCLYDVERVTMTIFQPRLQSVSTWSIKAKELYLWAEEELKPKAELAAKGEGEFISGSWCRFCKARNTCRARAESFLELARMEFQPPALLSEEEVAEVMEKADELSKWASDVMAYAQAEAIENGKRWNGYKLVEGRSVRKFTNEKVVEEAAKDAGYSDIYNKSLITLTAFEKLMGKETFKEVLGAYVTKPAGKLTLVPVSDKRPEVTVSTVNEEFLED